MSGRARQIERPIYWLQMPTGTQNCEAPARYHQAKGDRRWTIIRSPLTRGRAATPTAHLLSRSHLGIKWLLVSFSAIRPRDRGRHRYSRGIIARQNYTSALLVCRNADLSKRISWKCDSDTVSGLCTTGLQAARITSKISFVIKLQRQQRREQNFKTKNSKLVFTLSCLESEPMAFRQT